MVLLIVLSALTVLQVATSDVAENDNMQKQYLGTASSGYENKNGYNKDTENKQGKFENSGHYNFDKSDANKHLDKNSFSDEDIQHNDGGSEHDFNNQSAHKKGQHKAGFQNTYYKDEKGSNSSYYDDSDNQGDEYTSKSRKNHFGNTNSKNGEGSHLEQSHNSNENSKVGQYDVGGNYDRNLGQQDLYNRRNHYDDEDYKLDQERFYRRPVYYERPRSYSPKKTITIYEDPRYYRDQFYRSPQSYQNDRIQLDFRPPFGTQNRQYYTERLRY